MQIVLPAIEACLLALAWPFGLALLHRYLLQVKNRGQ